MLFYFLKLSVSVSFKQLVFHFRGVLLVQRDVGLLALCSQGQTALLQLRLRVIPVLVQNELLQHTNQTHMRANFQRTRNIRNQPQSETLSLAQAFISFLPWPSATFLSSFALTYLLSPWLGSPSVSSRWVQITGYLRQKPIPGQI